MKESDGGRDGWQVREMFQVEERREGDDEDRTEREDSEEGTRQTSTVLGFGEKATMTRAMGHGSVSLGTATLSGALMASAAGGSEGPNYSGPPCSLLVGLPYEGPKLPLSCRAPPYIFKYIM